MSQVLVLQGAALERIRELERIGQLEQQKAELRARLGQNSTSSSLSQQVSGERLSAVVCLLRGQYHLSDCLVQQLLEPTFRTSRC